MSLGTSPKTSDLLSTTKQFCEERLPPTSPYRYLHDHCHRLFPDEMFADLYETRGRNSIPPRIVAIVMVLQKLEGLSDREAVDRFTFDMRWKFACGGLDFEHDGFVHTVLVGMRARLHKSHSPNRIFDVVLEVAKGAGMVGRRRVLDSTPLYDAVATQDTVTLVRSAICGVLRVADAEHNNAMRMLLKREDDYKQPGKPTCNYEDRAERQALVDALAKDACALISYLAGKTLSKRLAEAAALLAAVIGQDIELSADGTFVIVRGVAKDRIISTVDPEARHGHKSSKSGFDGYKGHVSVDPDSEIITNTEVTPANVSDGDVLDDLIAPDIATAQPQSDASEVTGNSEENEPLEVYGDCAYATTDNLERLDNASCVANVKVPPASARNGHFSKDRFRIDLGAGTVTCPNSQTVPIKYDKTGVGVASFGDACEHCPLKAQCTNAKSGRTIKIHPKEELRQRHKARQRDPQWQDDYKATRPKVERKIGHMVRRRHGGRRGRMVGAKKLALDFSMLGAAVNIVRLAMLGVVPVPC